MLKSRLRDMLATRLAKSLVLLALASAMVLQLSEAQTTGTYGDALPSYYSSFSQPTTSYSGSYGSLEGGYPEPSGFASGWDVIATGLIDADANTVWQAIQDPRVAMSLAFRQFAFQVEGSGGFTHVILNSAEEFLFTLTKTDHANRYHHYSVFGHTRDIFNVDSLYLNIRNSQLFIMVKEKTSSTCELAVGLSLVVDYPSARNKLLFFLDGFLTQIVDHYQMTFGVADCTPDYHRETLGICNNLDHPTFGASETPLKRLPLYDPSYIDGISTPANANISPRHISNIVCDQGTDADNAENSMHVTDLFVFFGQFIDHDVGITPEGSFSSGKQPLFSFGHDKFRERYDIPVPYDDPVFQGPHRKDALSFERSIFVKEDGENVYPRIAPNVITAYLDLSQVYGADRVRAKALRAYVGGRLKTSGGYPGFLPYNGDGPGGIGILIENAPSADSGFYAAGDIRAQENSVLAALHALWLREHNNVAYELDVAFRAAGMEKSDEELFQYARDICVAEYQSIVYNEWLPLLLGEDVVPADGYDYNPDLSTSLDIFFTTASFRFGHSMVNNVLWLKNKFGDISTVKLEDVFFNPSSVNAQNFGSYLFGAACHEARELDTKVVDSLRSKLFTDDGGPMDDLVSLNIQRGRDHGLPSYNAARAAFSLPPFGDFSEVSSSIETQNRLREAYDNDISQVDAFIGGLAEDKPAGRLLGDLFHRSVADQFRRLRDGDRFFYKSSPFPPYLFTLYPRLQDILLDGVTLADIVHRNTEISEGVFEAYGDGPRSLFQLDYP